MARSHDPSAQPFLKWAGGKRQLLPVIRTHLPGDASASAYYEPFLGGGALLFDIQPAKATVNDVNAEIVNTYEVIRDEAEALIAALKRHRNDESHYYRVRGLDRSPEYAGLSKIERAARILFLNKTCYNGLFRVNRLGQFNVPFGRYVNPNIVNEAVIRAAGNYLRSARLTFRTGDFEDALKGIRKGSFVYFDPPYHPLSETSSFTGYSQKGFGEAEQERLKALCDRLDGMGCRFLLSNSHCPFITRLYKGYRQIKLEASRNINSVGGSRGKIFEILVKNYG